MRRKLTEFLADSDKGNIVVAVLVLLVAITVAGWVAYSISGRWDARMLKITGIDDYGNDLYKIEGDVEGFYSSYNYRGVLPDYAREGTYVLVEFGGEGMNPFGTEITEFLSPTLLPQSLPPILVLAVIASTVTLILALTRLPKKKTGGEAR